MGRTCPASESSLIGLLHGDLSRSAAGRAFTVPPSTSTSIIVTAKNGEICRTRCGSSSLHKEQIRFFPSVIPSLNAVVLVPITLFHRKEARCRSLLRLFYHCFIIIVIILSSHQSRSEAQIQSRQASKGMWSCACSGGEGRVSLVHYPDKIWIVQYTQIHVEEDLASLNMISDKVGIHSTTLAR